jgi:hypothetical protein
MNNLCGMPTKTGGECKNKVSDNKLACHVHISSVAPTPPQTMILEDHMDTLTPLIGDTFHYMVMTLDDYNRPLVVRRVLTNMDHIPFLQPIGEDEYLVPVDVGDAYSLAFMDHYCGDTPYWIEVVPVGMAKLADYPTCALAWADEESATFVMLENYPFWGGLERVSGLVIKPHMKLSKRLKEITRISRYFNCFTAGEITVHVFNPEDQVETYDGQTIVRPSFLEKLARTEKDRHYLRKHGKNGSFRLMTQYGLIKGDFIVAKSDDAIDFDVITSRDNVKSELKMKRDGEMWSSIFLHHDHHEASTDIQSMSWLGEHLFPQDLMTDTLVHVAKETMEDMHNGVFPKYMTEMSPDLGNHDEGDAGTIHFLRDMYTRWQMNHRSLNESAYFLHTIGTGFLNHMRKGMNFPIPHSVYCHVTTHELLWEAGYNIDGMEDKAFYHDATGRFSLPGSLFTKIFKNHGGWDLDDSVRVMVREFTDGIKAVLLRSPNAWGEYSIIDIDLDSLLPVLYHTYGDIPKMDVSVSEFKDVVFPIQRVDQFTTYEGMPVGGIELGEDYTPYTAQEIITGMAGSPGVGSWANSQMVYYATKGEFRTKQLAHTEDVVDTLTQSVNPLGFAAIKHDINSTWKAIKIGGVVEEYFIRFDKRVPKKIREGLTPVRGYMTEMAIKHRLVMNVFESDLRKASNNERVTIDPLMQIQVSPEAHAWAKKAVSSFKRSCDSAPKYKGFDFIKTDHFIGSTRVQLIHARSEFFRDLNRRVVNKVLSVPNGEELMVALYQWTEFKRSKGDLDGIDRILFAPNHKGEPSVMDLLVATINRVTA